MTFMLGSTVWLIGGENSSSTVASGSRTRTPHHETYGT